MLSAVVEWLALAVVVQAAAGAKSAAATARPWLGFVVLGVAVYASFTVWFFCRKPDAAGAAAATVRSALSAVPTMIAVASAFMGAPAWSLWTALAASGLLLTANVVVTRHEAAAQDHGIDLPVRGV